MPNRAKGGPGSCGGIKTQRHQQRTKDSKTGSGSQAGVAGSRGGMAQVMTVGLSRPVNSCSLETSSAVPMMLFSTSCASSSNLEASAV